MRIDRIPSTNSTTDQGQILHATHTRIPMMKLMNALSILAAVCGLALCANAAPTVVTPASEVATSQFGDWLNTIDGFGLSGGGSSGDILSETHAAGGGGNFALFPGGPDFTGETVTFTLPAASTVDRVHLWLDNSVWGDITGFDLEFSTDGGTTFPTTVTGITFDGAAGDLTVVQTRTFAEQTGVTHIKLSNVIVTGTDSATAYAGFNEIRFGGTAGSGLTDDFNAWISDPAFGLDPADQGFGLDPDGDGSDNGLENFFGTAPDEFSAGLLVGTVSGGTVTISHPQNATPADDIAGPFYMWSKDLVTFYGDGDTDGAGTTVDFVPSVNDPVTGVTTVAATVSGTATDKLFMTVSVSQIIPPPPLLSEDFESDNGGFTIAVPNKGTGTEWTHGAPNSPDQGGEAVIAGNNSSTQCWGTNLTGGYIAGTDACVRSPVIDLSGVTSAELSFALSIDSDTGHTYQVDVIEAATDNVIASVIAAKEDATNTTSPWVNMSSIAIPGAAIGQSVRLEWRFIGDGTAQFNGAYLDDVVVTGTP